MYFNICILIDVEVAIYIFIFQIWPNDRAVRSGVFEVYNRDELCP